MSHWHADLCCFCLTSTECRKTTDLCYCARFLIFFCTKKWWQILHNGSERKAAKFFYVPYFFRKHFKETGIVLGIHHMEKNLKMSIDLHGIKDTNKTKNAENIYTCMCKTYTVELSVQLLGRCGLSDASQKRNSIGSLSVTRYYSVINAHHHFGQKTVQCSC